MSSMSQNNSCVDVPKDSFLAARRAWPTRGHDDQLPAPVRRVYDSWMMVSEKDRLEALEAAVREGFSRRPGRDSDRAQCQDLTLSGSPLPAAHSDVRLLTSEQIVSMGAPPPPEPQTARGRRALAVRNSDSWVESDLLPRRGRQAARDVTPGAAELGERPGRARSAPPSALEERVLDLEASDSSRTSSPARSAVETADKRVMDLERKLAMQEEERIRQLFAQQLAEPNEDVSSSYVVLDEIWHKLGKNAADNRCSWLNINALKKRDASEIIRMHSGTFPHFPCELDVVGVMKRLPGVKDAQLTLVDFAQNEVARFMRANARTVRLSGTAYSRALEFQQELAEIVDHDPHATVLPLDCVLEFVDKVVGATRGSFAMSLLDTQTGLRLAVSHRLEKAMKVNHLTTNPLKAEREDFIPPVVMQRIEDAAKRNLDLSWALDQATGKQVSGRHPANSSRGGKSDYARQRGRGGGTQKGTSKGSKGGASGLGGRGKGRGTPNATPKSDTRMAFTDASSDK